MPAATRWATTGPVEPLDRQLLERWDTDGWFVLEGAVEADALGAAQRDLPGLFPTAEEFADDADPERNRPFRTRSDALVPRFPFASEALNRLVVHDDVVDVAAGLLGTSDIRLYQGMVSAKYTDGAPDYDQLLHADYANHTLVVPRHDAGYQQVEMFLYLSDVAADTAATRMVSRRATGGIPVERTYLSFDEYPELYAAEVPAAGPAGSLLVYRPDTYHRGTVLRAARSARFLLHIAFKRPGTDWLGFHSWPSAAEGMDWYRFVRHASVRQLSLLGFPALGDPYWTEATLAGVGARYPQLDMTPWRLAMTAEVR